MYTISIAYIEYDLHIDKGNLRAMSNVVSE